MITLQFRYNPAIESTPADEPQCWAHEQFPSITVKSVSAAWNWIRKYRDEAGEIVENEILEITFDEPTQKDKMPSAIQFKRNSKGKLEFKDIEKKKTKKASSTPCKQKSTIKSLTSQEIARMMLN